MLFNYVLQHNLNCPFHFLPDQTKQKSCIIINVMLGSRTRTQFSICFNQQNSFAPVFMIESNRLYFYFSEVPIILHSVIFVAFNFIRKLIKYYNMLKHDTSLIHHIIKYAILWLRNMA